MEWLAHPIAQGILAGIVGGLSVDYNAFRQMKTWSDFKTYRWKTAGFRMFQGGVVGFLTALGSMGLISLST